MMNKLFLKLFALILLESIFLFSLKLMAYVYVPYTDCWSCNQRIQFQQQPIAPWPYANRLAYTPWYQWYGVQNFQNYYYPAAWYGPGFNSNTYPGNGPIYAAKPNIYIQAPDKTKIELKLNFNSQANLLVAVPIYGKQGWAIESQDGKVQVGQVSYDYLYYDYRLQENDLQSESGFCGDREEMIQRMIEILDKRNYQHNEIEDFLENAYAKLPRQSQLCVFPQTDKELNSQLSFEFNHKKFSLERLLFIIAPQDMELIPKLKRFSIVPEKNFDIPKSKKTDFVIREWGLGFLQGH